MTNTSKYAPECPCCEGIITKPISKGRSDSGNPARSYRCLTCAEQFCPNCADTAHRFTTTEVVLPHGVTLDHIDTALRDAKREWHRAHHGYTGKSTGKRRMADLDLNIRIVAYDRRTHKNRLLTTASVGAHLPPASATAVRERKPRPEAETYVAPHGARLLSGSKRGLHGTQADCEVCGQPIYMGIFGVWKHHVDEAAA